MQQILVTLLLFVPISLFIFHTMLEDGNLIFYNVLYSKKERERERERYYILKYSGVYMISLSFSLSLSLSLSLFYISNQIIPINN